MKYALQHEFDDEPSFIVDSCDDGEGEPLITVAAGNYDLAKRIVAFLNSEESPIEPTPVIFRADKSGPHKGEVTAVFPTLPADYAGRFMTCFAHIGQHGSCDYGWYAATRPAKPEEYADLKRELESAPYGYRLQVCQRMTPKHRAAFNEAVREYRA